MKGVRTVLLVLSLSSAVLSAAARHARKVTRTAAVAVVVAAVLGGCLGGGDDGGGASDCLASANGSMKLAHSWAYDGEELIGATGQLAIDVDDGDNTGTVTGDAEEGDGPGGWEWGVAFTDFVEGSPFHDGGVVTDLTEHGDSGVGDENIPKVHLDCAGWGPVTVRLNGVAINEDDVGYNLTGHFMVSSTGVRDDATGKILAQDGTTPYSPDRPADALRSPGDYEFWLIARTPAGNEPATIPPLVFADTVTTANYNRAWNFDVLSTATIDVQASARNQAAGPLVGQLNVALRDPDGGTASTTTLGGTGQTTSGGLTLDDATAGPYSLLVTGNGVQMAYTLTVTLTYPDGFLLVLFWEDGKLET